MPFDPVKAKEPISVGYIKLLLSDTPVWEDPEWVRKRTTAYRFVINYDDGSDKRHIGDLTPHLTPQEIAGLQTLMDRLVAEVEGLIDG